ncbi:PQQ-like beta-propeller repeat protein [Sulfurimonas sp.]|nr:PQQ-like beta-propeller repeat protein [Sulfurimonas sp.]
MIKLLILSVALLFTACSTRESYQPKEVVGDWEKYGDSDFSIENIAPNAALVEDKKVFASGSVNKIKVPDGHSLLGFSDGWILSTNIVGDLSLQHADDFALAYSFTLKKTIAAASVNGDTLAVLFANNEMALYSLSEKNLLLKIQGNAPLAVNYKIITPYFRDDLVLFSTLDGKVVIANVKTKKKLRTSIVSSEDNFNNIIYFNFVENKIIAATAHKIMSLSRKEAREKYDIRGVIDDGRNIFLATKQGEIVSITSDLQINAKAKFPFAHFLGMIISNDKLYVLEKAGYMIEFSKDLLEYKVYDVDLDEGYVFIQDKKFYVDDEYISVE